MFISLTYVIDAVVCADLFVVFVLSVSCDSVCRMTCNDSRACLFPSHCGVETILHNPNL